MNSKTRRPELAAARYPARSAERVRPSASLPDLDPDESITPYRAHRTSEDFVGSSAHGTQGSIGVMNVFTVFHSTP